MGREIITITDEGTIVVPDNPNKVRMTVIEIAKLLGIYYLTAKRHVRAIEKTGVADGDYKMACIVDGNGVHPEYYDLEMIVAVAFRIHSHNADIFRRWLIKRAAQPATKLRPPISVFVPMGESGLPN
jgi:hypothetical protein